MVHGTTGENATVAVHRVANAAGTFPKPPTLQQTTPVRHTVTPKTMISNKAVFLNFHHMLHYFEDLQGLMVWTDVALAKLMGVWLGCDPLPASQISHPAPAFIHQHERPNARAA